MSDATFDLAVRHHKAGRLAQAEQLYLQVLAEQPGHVDAFHHYAVIAHQVDHPEALDLLRRSLAANPDCAPYLINLGTALYTRGHYGEATDCFRRAITLQPDHADAHHNLALVRLLHGDFREGWEEFEWRTKTENVRAIRLEGPKTKWDGSRLQGRRLMLHVEQGIGDTLQFIRLVPEFLKREPGAKLVILCDPTLETLLQRCLAPYATVASTVERGSFDLWYPLMSLPRALGITSENLPADVPYLAANRRQAKLWRERLAADRSPCRVGLAWAGNASHLFDRYRSMPLAAFAPLNAVPGVSFYALQKGEAARQMQTNQSIRLINATAALHTFDDTAALIANLDLIISVDTAVAHLAGAMGKPVWTLLPFSPDWRWRLGRDDSAWYPTMRLFRQTEIRKWDDVIARVAQALAERTSGVQG